MSRFVKEILPRIHNQTVKKLHPWFSKKITDPDTSKDLTWCSLKAREECIQRIFEEADGFHEVLLRAIAALMADHTDKSRMIVEYYLATKDPNPQPMDVIRSTARRFRQSLTKEKSKGGSPDDENGVPEDEHEDPGAGAPCFDQNPDESDTVLRT